ncbi:flagellar filament capping protein FliD [Cohnella hashimotonis]|uniref:Flagellar hook-associated protein 2 n=1 Tax=Cohnella hashimotonis TaxID=2826895 RepID=A0ABT6TU16_9BACL|nr:flagellar filament capping protein FliD [Cohnella hashimotonis]MDI4650361.1 flagellar filament capping protein FliD [Cohnella hashimotonis]
MVNRITGLASGMDIDSMVKKLMDANRIPLTRLNQQKTVLTWQRDAYRAVNTKISDFRNVAFDMKLNSNFNSRKATSDSDDSISVSGTATATEGTYKIKVDQVAETAKLTSSGAVGAKALSGLDTKLGDLNLAADTTLTIGGEKGTATIVVKKTDSLDTLIKAINNKSNTTGVKVSYDTTLDHFFFASSGTGSNAKVDLKSEDGSLISNVFKLTPGSPVAGSTVTGTQTFADGATTRVNKDLTTAQTLRIGYDGKTVDFTVDATTQIGNLIDQINNSDIGKKGVTAYLDANNKLAFTNPTDQTVKPIMITDQTSDAKDVVANLGFTAPVTTPRSTAGLSGSGKDAIIEYNGVTGTYATNTFSINGLNFTAKKVMTTEANITVSQDTDAIYDKIKTFVDKYNEMIGSINSTLDEKQYRDFTPLTDEQRSNMKEDEIKSWEAKAKSGLIRNDQMISSALNGFRLSLSSVVSGLPSGDIKQLSQIGITTGTYAEKGKLYIDPTALKKAISEHPDEVSALFTATDGGNKTSNTGDGLATRLVEQADNLMASLKTKAGTASSVDSTYTMGKRIGEFDKRISAMSTMLDDMETKYYNQFSAMETYINQMNAQSAYLSQQFGTS